MLEVRDISASYGRIQALSGISLTVAEGKIVGLLGANGAGKTTTLNCVSALVPITSGSIHLGGQRNDGIAPDRVVRHGICQVPEGREIFYHLSVRDNLELGAYLRRDRAGVEADYERVLHFFPRLRDRLVQAAGTLSGGEQQMLLIARALMGRPRLLVLDEPSLGLSPVLVETIFDIIVQLNKQGLTILLVEQNASLALDVSDYAYILQNGEVSVHGEPHALRDNPAVQAAYLGA